MFEPVAVAEKTHGRYGELVYGPMVQTAAYSGLRPGELHGLRWEDVDLVREMVRVERAVQPKGQHIYDPEERSQP